MTTQTRADEWKVNLSQRIKRNFPAELQSLDRFIIWKYGPTRKNGKRSKMPIDPDTEKAVDAKKPETWLSLDAAISALCISSKAEGIGFVFNGDGYAGVDFDDCIENNVLNSDVQKWVDTLRTYSEDSPSRKGVHCIVKLSEAIGKRKNGVEIYSNERFFTVTGNIRGEFRNAVNIDHCISDLCNVYGITQEESHTEEDKTKSAAPQSNSDLWALMFRCSKRVDVKALFDGNTSGYNNDESAADMALAGSLAFWTGKDEERISEMMHETALVRDKWDRDDYLPNTIKRAIENCKDVYKANGYTGGGNVGGDPQAFADYLASIDSTTTHTPVLPKTETKKQTTTQRAESSLESGETEDEPYSATVTRKLTDLGYTFALNLLDSSVEVNGKRIDDITESIIFSQMRDKGFKATNAIKDVFTAIAAKNAYHPVKKYLEGLKWDGKNHIAQLATYFNCASGTIAVNVDGKKGEAPLFRVWLGKWLIGAVAKVYPTGAIRAQPPMLVLIGPQDMGKSVFVRWLGSPLDSLFIESEIDPDNKEHKRYLATKFVWEVGELGATTRKADRESLKNFITTAETTIRTPYAKYDIIKPVLASFIGTVNNEDGFLSDPTGNRRFLCADLTSIDHSYQNDIDINQVWAQAYALFKAGESWRLTDDEKAVQAKLNDSYRKEPPLLGWVAKMCDVDPANSELRCTTSEIVKLLQKADVTGGTKQLEMSVSDVMKHWGLTQDTNARPRQWRGAAIKPKMLKKYAETDLRDIDGMGNG